MQDLLLAVSALYWIAIFLLFLWLNRTAARIAGKLAALEEGGPGRPGS